MAASRRRALSLAVVLLAGVLPAGVLGACRAAPPAASTELRRAGSLHDTKDVPDSTAASPALREIPLAGPLADAEAEVSGLAWHEDRLLLLPQYPFQMAGQADHGVLYALAREEIEAFLSGEHEEPLRPQPLTLLAPSLRERSPAYQGCEALAVRGGRAYLATEAVADASTGAMHGFLFGGHLRGDTLRLDVRRRAALPTQTDIPNMAYEALVAAPRRLLALYEANGRNANPRARVAAFSPDLREIGMIPFPPLEYRLTDATALSTEGHFWVVNYFFPGEREKLRPASTGNAPLGPVERLVEYRVAGDRIERSRAAPLRLSTRADAPRNWEGVARFRSETQGDGFLLATDQYPRTMLAFVAAGASPP